jgi:hypothetical protein
VLAVGIAATAAGSVAGGPLGFREAPPAGRPTTPTAAPSSSASPATPDPGPPTVSASASTNDKGGRTYEVTRCSTVRNSDLPRDTSYDTGLDRERGLVTITFAAGGGVDRQLTVDYVRDAACREPGRRISEIVEGALGAG